KEGVHLGVGRGDHGGDLEGPGIRRGAEEEDAHRGERAGDTEGFADAPRRPEQGPLTRLSSRDLRSPDPSSVSNGRREHKLTTAVSVLPQLHPVPPVETHLPPRRDRQRGGIAGDEEGRVHSLRRQQGRMPRGRGGAHPRVDQGAVRRAQAEGRGEEGQAGAAGGGPDPPEGGGGLPARDGVRRQGQGWRGERRG
ncbi:hypothetical protein THAOC_33004, partial [Thalassiosira oceanica]